MIYCNFVGFDYMKIKGHHISRVLFGLYIMAVGAVCFSRPESIPSITFDWFGLPADKIVHCMMFIPFPILAFLAFIPGSHSNVRKIVDLALIGMCGAAIAYATEQVQGMLGYRSLEINDFLADIMGISVGVTVMLGVIVLKTRQK